MREREESNAYHNKILSHWSLTLLLTLFLIDKKYIRRGFVIEYFIQTCSSYQKKNKLSN